MRSSPTKHIIMKHKTCDKGIDCERNLLGIFKSLNSLFEIQQMYLVILKIIFRNTRLINATENIHKIIISANMD